MNCTSSLITDILLPFTQDFDTAKKILQSKRSKKKNKTVTFLQRLGNYL